MESADAGNRSDIRLWFAGHALLVPLGTEPVMQGNKLLSMTKQRLFMLDTGSESSYLTDHYLAEHAAAFPGLPPETARLAGADGIHEIRAYAAHSLPLSFGNNPVVLNGTHILAHSTSGESEHYFGIIGQDLLRTFSRYTLDFRTGAFSVQP